VLICSGFFNGCINQELIKKIVLKKAEKNNGKIGIFVKYIETIHRKIVRVKD